MKGEKKTIHTSATYCWQDEQKQPCICMTAWRKSPPTSLSWLTWINSSTLALSSVLCPESMMQRGWGQFCQSRKNRSTHTYTLSHTHTLVYFFLHRSPSFENFFAVVVFRFLTLSFLFLMLYSQWVSLFSGIFFHLSLSFFPLFHFLFPPPFSLYTSSVFCDIFKGEGKEFSGIKHILPNFFERRWAAVLNKVNLGLVKYTIYICKYICKQSGAGYKWKENNFRLSLIFHSLLIFRFAYRNLMVMKCLHILNSC